MDMLAQNIYKQASVDMYAALAGIIVFAIVLII